MNPVLIELVVHAVKEKYVSEKAFYTEELGISPQSWDRWKKGDQGLRYENIQIISNLFTDYEWMLVQKIARKSEFTGFISDPIAEFNFLKYQIAKKWLNHGIAHIHWTQSEQNEAGSIRMSNKVTLRLVMDYGLWGYSDIIEISLPGVIQQQIGHDERKLLQYVSDETDRIKDQ